MKHWVQFLSLFVFTFFAEQNRAKQVGTVLYYDREVLPLSCSWPLPTDTVWLFLSSLRIDFIASFLTWTELLEYAALSGVKYPFSLFLSFFTPIFLSNWFWWIIECSYMHSGFKRNIVSVWFAHELCKRCMHSECVRVPWNIPYMLAEYSGTCFKRNTYNVLFETACNDAHFCPLRLCIAMCKTTTRGRCRAGVMSDLRLAG